MGIELVYVEGEVMRIVLCFSTIFFSRTVHWTKVDMYMYTACGTLTTKGTYPSVFYVKLFNIAQVR